MPSLPPSDEARHRQFVLEDVEAWLGRRDAPSGKADISAPDLQSLASALGKTMAAARDEDGSGLVDALRAVAASEDRLAETLSEEGLVSTGVKTSARRPAD
jgi:hypothetical protein